MLPVFNTLFSVFRKFLSTQRRSVRGFNPSGSKMQHKCTLQSCQGNFHTPDLERTHVVTHRGQKVLKLGLVIIRREISSSPIQAYPCFFKFGKELIFYPFDLVLQESFLHRLASRSDSLAHSVLDWLLEKYGDVFDINLQVGSHAKKTSRKYLSSMTRFYWA